MKIRLEDHTDEQNSAKKDTLNTKLVGELSASNKQKRVKINVSVFDGVTS